ncbi:MAG: NACHT domain-containing protein [Candidatus Electrothrix sp. MAN1_4]|nr:NACHT domain-containing protein [Candidatus Electrothrix sp. MAN1_4]
MGMMHFDGLFIASDFSGRKAMTQVRWDVFRQQREKMENCMEWLDWITAGLRWLKENPEVTWSGAGFTILGILYLVVKTPLTAIIRRLQGKPPLSEQQNSSKKWFIENRHKLLGNLKEELKERRKSFLLGQNALALKKELAPDEVRRYSRRDNITCVLVRDGMEQETTDQSITELFQRPDVDQRLAILGKPGSGKTVCLLDLVEHLLAQAKDDTEKPLPIVFECSEWDGRELVPWMAWQLNRKHPEIPEKIALQMVEGQDILPLFDGLDELAAEKQAGFVQRFNKLPNNRPQVVCCRVMEYKELHKNSSEKLALENAVVLQDISQTKLKGHFLRHGLDDLWKILEKSANEDDLSSPASVEGGQEAEQTETLLELAQRPLFMGIMIVVAEKLSEGGWKRQPGESWEDSLWRAYLSDCLAERAPQPNQGPDDHDRKYAKAPSRHWLHCLARWMQDEDKVALHVDELQPSMLKGYWRFGLLYGVVIGIVHGLALGIFWGTIFGVAIGISSGLQFALPGSLTLKEDVKILVGVAWGVSALLIEGPLACLIVALIFILIMDNEPRKISPILLLHLPTSCRKVQTFISLLLAWLGYGIVMGIYFGVIIGLVHMKGISMGEWLAFMSALSPALSFLIGAAYALRMIAGPTRKTTYPQERLNDALYNSLALFPLFNLSAILLFLQILLIAEQLNLSVGIFYNMSLFYTVLL